MSRPKLKERLDALTSLSAAQLSEEWSKVAEGSAPNVPTALLRRLIAQRLQEKRYRGLPAMVARELDAIAMGDKPVSGGSILPPPASIRLGTRLMREWNGQTISVTSVENGFEYEGKHYGSLSQIAKQVTGTHWSGPRFFGLVKRSAAHG